MNTKVFDPYVQKGLLTDLLQTGEDYDAELPPLDGREITSVSLSEFTFRYDGWLPVEAEMAWRKLIGEIDKRLESTDTALPDHAWIEAESRIRSAYSLLAVPTRVFVSYRTLDRPMALQMARYLQGQGKLVWLDVWDPRIAWVKVRRLPKPIESRLVALMVEIALLNCSHLVVVHTRNTGSSAWVPYELGRTKARTPLAHNAAFWHGNYSLPGYAHLVARFERPNDRLAFAAWVSRI